MNYPDLITQLKTDINNWLKLDACKEISSKEIPSIFTCEADFQQRLCRHLLASGKYDIIIPEYKIPFELIKEIFDKNGYSVPSIIYPWSNDLRLDIVVKEKNSDKYAIIELKYATKEIYTNTLFGETFGKQFQLLKNHDASNIVMYNYWKDVRRIEMICRNFKNVVGGLTVLLTNSDVYLNKPASSTAAYSTFSTYNGHEIGELDSSTTLKWSKKVSIEKNHPEFLIEGFYKCVWNDSCFYNPEMTNGIFRFLINEIRGPKTKFWKPYNIIIDKTTTVGEFVDSFFDNFGLRLKVKSGNKNVSPEISLTNLGGKIGKLEFRSSITVGSLIKRIKDKLNIDVSIFTKDAWVKVFPDITISNAGQIPAGATKAKMERFRNYKRKGKN